MLHRADGTPITSAEIQGLRKRAFKGHPRIPITPSASEKHRPCGANSQVAANFYGAPPRCVFCGVSRLMHELRERD